MSLDSSPTYDKYHAWTVTDDGSDSPLTLCHLRTSISWSKNADISAFGRGK